MSFPSLTVNPRAWWEGLRLTLGGTTYLMSGGALTAHGAGSMQVDVAAYTAWVNGVFVSYAGGNVLPAAGGALPRIDLIVNLSGAAVPSVVAGVAANPPTPPALPANALFLGHVFVGINALDYTVAPSYVADYTMPFALGAGSAAQPGLALAAELTTGFFRPLAGALSISALGVEQARFGAVVSAFLQLGVAPANGGTIRLPNQGTLAWLRNGGGNIITWGTDAADTLKHVDGSTTNFSITNGGDVTARATLTLGTSPAGTGTIRLPNLGSVYGRNAANTGNLALISIGADNNVYLGDLTNLVSVFQQLQVGSNISAVAASGVIRIPNAQLIRSRNAANTQDRTIASHDASDNIIVGDPFALSLQLAAPAGSVDFRYATTALGGGAAPTFGTIGGGGPAAAAQNSWLKVLINGTASFIPIWR